MKTVVVKIINVNKNSHYWMRIFCYIYNLFIIYNAKPTILVALNNLPKIYLFEADSVKV